MLRAYLLTAFFLNTSALLASDFTGLWSGTLTDINRNPAQISFMLHQDGSKVRGYVIIHKAVTALDGATDHEGFEVKARLDEGTLHYVLLPEGNKLEGSGWLDIDGSQLNTASVSVTRQMPSRDHQGLNGTWFAVVEEIDNGHKTLNFFTLRFEQHNTVITGDCTGVSGKALPFSDVSLDGNHLLAQLTTEGTTVRFDLTLQKNELNGDATLTFTNGKQTAKLTAFKQN